MQGGVGREASLAICHRFGDSGCGLSCSLCFMFGFLLPQRIPLEPSTRPFDEAEASHTRPRLRLFAFAFRPHAFQSHLGSYPSTLFALEISNNESFCPAVGVYGTPGKQASTSFALGILMTVFCSRAQ